MRCIRLYTYFGLMSLFLSAFSVPTYAQTALSAKPSLTQPTKIAISGNIALYAFLRVAAADKTSSPSDQARSRALLAQIGLGELDREKLADVFEQYTTNIRLLHSSSTATSSVLDLQRKEITSYANVIQRIRKELSADGIQKLRIHLEAKTNQMTLHTREEISK